VLAVVHSTITKKCNPTTINPQISSEMPLQNWGAVSQTVLPTPQKKGTIQLIDESAMGGINKIRRARADATRERAYHANAIV
jgi:hypothetical protein